MVTHQAFLKDYINSIIAYFYKIVNRIVRRITFCQKEDIPTGNYLATKKATLESAA